MLNISVPYLCLGLLFPFVCDLLLKFNLLYLFASSIFLLVLFLFVSQFFWKINLLYFFVCSLSLWVLFLFESGLLWKINMLYFDVSFIFLWVFFFVSWLFQKQKPAKYDVFVSFSDKDIPYWFYSHLMDTFKSKQINAFVADKLGRQDQIQPSLVEAIKASSISLIIFSPDYASSRWCLDELVTILKCKEKYGQIIIPVFYKVEPKHVKHQSSKTYRNAFAEHQRENETEVQIWRDALEKTAKVSGLVSSDKNDAELVEEIVNIVLMKMSGKGTVGLEKKIAAVESCIRAEPKTTRIIGIWGMSGIGKTTLVKEVFNKLQSEYEGYYFSAHEREESSTRGICSLKEKMFSKLLGCSVKMDTLLPKDIVRKVSCMKVLIVLDDVYDLEQLEKLVGTLRNFGSGSRIIITARDLQVLKDIKTDEKYKLEELSSDEALELFKLNVFNQSSHQRQYNELSKKVVHYTQGIPLVVKALAGHLRGKKRKVWESELDKLEKMPLTKVYDVMKLCYDGLDRKEQQTFLDLACFFLRTHEPVNVGYLESLLKDNESDNPVVSELERLKDKALITFSGDNFVSMHDSVQEMAWEIVRQESMKDPGSRSWLWNPNDIIEALKNVKGIESIRSILLHWPTVKNLNISPQVVAKMSRLQYLKIDELYYCNSIDPFDILGTNTCRPKRQNARIVDILAEGLQFLSTELRFLCWYHYPLKTLPENFSAKKLVVLKLLHSRMEILWHGVKNLMNLKDLDLSGSENLKELPDLSTVACFFDAQEKNPEPSEKA